LHPWPDYTEKRIGDVFAAAIPDFAVGAQPVEPLTAGA